MYLKCLGDTKTFLSPKDLRIFKKFKKFINDSIIKLVSSNISKRFYFASIFDNRWLSYQLVCLIWIDTGSNLLHGSSFVESIQTLWDLACFVEFKFYSGFNLSICYISTRGRTCSKSSKKNKSMTWFANELLRLLMKRLDVKWSEWMNSKACMFEQFLLLLGQEKYVEVHI